MKRTATLLLFTCLSPYTGSAGSADSTLSVDLNIQRVHTNQTGMKILGTWGAVNMISGIAGRLSSTDDEWKHFHEMNALWGAVNLGIATAGYLGARLEALHNYSLEEAARRHKSIKHLFLINAGLDLAYIATGTYLLTRADKAPSNTEKFNGWGRSLIIQGLGLLTFDIAMFGTHSQSDKAWQKALNGLSFSGNSINWRYSFR